MNQPSAPPPRRLPDLRVGLRGSPDVPTPAARYAAWTQAHALHMVGGFHDGLAVWLPGAEGALELVHLEGAARLADDRFVPAVSPHADLDAALRAARHGGPPQWVAGANPEFSVRVRPLPGGAVGATWDRAEGGVRADELPIAVLGALSDEVTRLATSIAGLRPVDVDDAATQLTAVRGLGRVAWRLRGVAGAVEPSPPARLNAALDKIALDVQERVGAEVELLWAVPQGLPEVTVPHDVLRFLITELVDNAVRNPAGAPERVKVAAGLMRLRSRRAWQGATLVPGRYTWLEVIDDGPGLPPDTLSDPFDARPGGGLGLAAVRGLVVACGGAVRLRSVAGRGTVVQLALPARGRPEAGVRLWVDEVIRPTEERLLSALTAAGLRVARYSSAAPLAADQLLPLVLCVDGAADPRWTLLSDLLDSDAHANLIVWAPGVDPAAAADAVASEDQLLTVVHSGAAEDVVRAATVALD
ncbi:MAG: ATP-binding protein [Deltaproteobacteria bacterium]|nr:ATP-binding protein [Deltaproteobacteria bacterium]